MGTDGQFFELELIGRTGKRENGDERPDIASIETSRSSLLSRASCVQPSAAIATRLRSAPHRLERHCAETKRPRKVPSVEKIDRVEILLDRVEIDKRCESWKRRRDDVEAEAEAEHTVVGVGHCCIG